MMSATFIAGDWGTSHLRLCLCDAAGNVLERKDGPGIGAVRGNAGEAFLALAEPWGPLPVVLCGMAGSSIGWREAAYLPCPADPDAIGRHALRFDIDDREIAIAPGLSCENRLGAPDVLRGEETQILGALHHHPVLRAGAHLICMPGTHTKWVWMKDGVIAHFLTALTGELFDLLQRHSVLVKEATGKVAPTAFALGLAQAARFPEADLLHLLFQVRARQLRGELKPDDAGACLSGILIGRDVAGALRLFKTELGDSADVVIIGAAALSDLYATALASCGRPVIKIDGMASSFAGLTTLYSILRDKGVIHAA